MKKPIRIQRSRQHKQVSPNGLDVVYVGRPSKWGNPYKVGELSEDSLYPATNEQAVAYYKDKINKGYIRIKIRTELQGKNLSCWCPIGEPCHADVLLKIANDPNQ